MLKEPARRAGVPIACRAKNPMPAGQNKLEKILPEISRPRAAQASQISGRHISAIEWQKTSQGIYHSRAADTARRSGLSIVDQAKKFVPETQKTHKVLIALRLPLTTRRATMPPHRPYKNFPKQAFSCPFRTKNGSSLRAKKTQLLATRLLFVKGVQVSKNLLWIVHYFLLGAPTIKNFHEIFVVGAAQYIFCTIRAHISLLHTGKVPIELTVEILAIAIAQCHPHSKADDAAHLSFCAIIQNP